jgi:hypothetical protein
MLEISLSTDPSCSPEISIRATRLCVSGGTIRIEPNLGADITYDHGMWAYGGRSYRMLAITGSLYLVFGIAREPTIVSHPFDHFHIIGPIISTDGVSIAKYSEHQNTWHGLLRPMWWVSMRIVTSDKRHTRPQIGPTFPDRPWRRTDSDSEYALSRHS